MKNQKELRYFCSLLVSDDVASLRFAPFRMTNRIPSAFSVIPSKARNPL